jgi:hypothetical protein
MTTIIRTLLVAAAFTTACTAPEDPVASATSDLRTPAVAPLPCFAETPNIAAAAATRLPPGTWVRALFNTASGAQIYRCDRNAAGVPTWTQRTPFAQLVPTRQTEQRLGGLAMSLHHRSDFGTLLTPLELGTLGLVDASGVATNAPVWSVMFPAPGAPETAEEREVVAGRVIAQDVVGTGNIPNLLLEVRGRSVAGLVDGIVVGATSVADATADPIAASDYILRWNLRGGVAPAASLCTEATLGSESQQPYRADYYFLETTPSS